MKYETRTNYRSMDLPACCFTVSPPCAALTLLPAPFDVVSWWDVQCRPELFSILAATMALPLEAESYLLLQKAGTQSVHSDRCAILYCCLLLGLHQMPMEWFVEVQQVLWPAEQIEESCQCLSMLDYDGQRSPSITAFPGCANSLQDRSHRRQLPIGRLCQRAGSGVLERRETPLDQ